MQIHDEKTQDLGLPGSPDFCAGLVHRTPTGRGVFRRPANRSMIGNAIGGAFLPQQSFQNPHGRNQIVGVKPIGIGIDGSGILPFHIKKPVPE